MEEFDFDLNNEIGTSVSQLRTNNSHASNNLENIKHSDTEFDYGKIMENFNSDPTINNGLNYDTNRDTLITTMSNVLSRNDKEPIERFSNINNEIRPKKQQNMNRFIKDLENNLDNFNKINLNEPLPVNFTKQMMPKTQFQYQRAVNIEPMINVTEQKKIVTESKPLQIEEKSGIDIIKKLFNFEFREVIVSMLLFMVLNNKIIIELIYNKLPIINTWNSPYPNLLFRTIIFGLILILLKKFNL